MGQVPTSLKVVGILGIILSSLILVATPCGIFMMYHPLAPNPVTERLYQDQTVVGYSLASGILNSLLAAVLLASSIGCLKAKRWARPGMNTYAIAHIVMATVGMIFNFVVLTPKMQEIFDAMPAGPGKLPPDLFKMSQTLGAVFGILFAGGISVTILILVNRKIAVAAFNGTLPPEQPAIPGHYPPPPLPR